MATETERPPSRIGKKVNPAYTAWRKEQKEKALTAPEAGTLLLRAVKLARNEKFVMCAHEGKCVGVRIRRGNGPRLLKKTIRVDARADGTFHHLP